MRLTSNVSRLNNMPSHHLTRKRMVLPWSAFNALGRNRIVRSSYLWAVAVPILAKMLSGISRDFELGIPTLHVKLVLGVPFAWELLYYSAVCFALASLTYSTLCPEIIKAYDRFSDFSDQGKGSEQLVAFVYGTSADRRHTTGKPQLPEQQLLQFLESYCGVDKLSIDDPEHQSRQTYALGLAPEKVHVQSNRLAQSFWYVHGWLDYDSPLVRYLLAALYSVGFVLFGVVMVQNFAYVVALHLPRGG